MIRLMRSSDLSFADQLRQIVGWNQTRVDWQRLLRYEPEGCFLAEHDGSPAGTATTTCYETALAWIGMVLVHPDHRKHGIGTALMQRCLEYLDQKKIACVKLDATPQGQPLYQRLGFKDEWTLQRWENKSLQPLSVVIAKSRPWNHEATQLDAIAYGVDRRAFLEALRTESARVIVDGTRGFGLMRKGSRAYYLGPVEAENSAIALDIVRELLSSATGQPLFWDIPDHQHAAIALARELGFAPQRTLIRMYRGEQNLAGKLELLYGITGPETG